MNEVFICTPDGGARLQLSGGHGYWVLRTSFSPFSQRGFVDALDDRFDVERVRVRDADEPGGSAWPGVFELRAPGWGAAELAEVLEGLLLDTFAWGPLG